MDPLQYPASPEGEKRGEQVVAPNIDGEIIDNLLSNALLGKTVKGWAQADAIEHERVDFMKFSAPA